MGQNIKPPLVLAVLMMVVVACLSFVFDVTEEPIRLQAEMAQAAAMQRLLYAEVYDELSVSPYDIADSTVTAAWQALDGNEVVGYIIAASPRGFGGRIDMLVAINTQGLLEGVEVVRHTETPGLGTPIQTEAFTVQYVGQAGPFTVTRSSAPGQYEIQALTSATASTVGVTNGVNDAVEYFRQHLQ